MIYIYQLLRTRRRRVTSREGVTCAMSALTFLATAFTVIFAVSMVVALVIHDPEEGAFIQTTIEVFWLIAHITIIVGFAIVYIAALLWGISI